MRQTLRPCTPHGRARPEARTSKWFIELYENEVDGAPRLGYIEADAKQAVVDSLGAAHRPEMRVLAYPRSSLPEDVTLWTPRFAGGAPRLRHSTMSDTQAPAPWRPTPPAPPLPRDRERDAPERDDPEVPDQDIPNAPPLRNAPRS